MKFSSLLLSATLLAGMALAQGPGQGGPRRAPGPRPGPGGFLNGGNAERRLTRALSLTAEQQNKVHTVLQEQQVMAKGLSDQTATLRTQLGAAVRAGDEGKIDQITRDMSQLNQQRSAISAKTLAKIYGTLTIDQKAIMDKSLNRELGIPGQRPRPRQTPATPPAAQ